MTRPGYYPDDDYKGPTQGHGSTSHLEVHELLVKPEPAGAPLDYELDPGAINYIDNHYHPEFLIVWLYAAVAALIFLMGFATGRATAHEAPTGWSYPTSCCSGVDCRPVPAEWIKEGAGAYTIVNTGEVVPMTDTRVRLSPDGEFHWCSSSGADDGRTICLYVPPRSF